MATSVDELDRLSESGQLGLVKEGRIGWPEWALARSECREVVQEVRAWMSSPFWPSEEPAT